MATRAEINEKHGIIRLMPPDIANEQLSEEDAALYERIVKMQIQEFDDFENEDNRKVE